MLKKQYIKAHNVVKVTFEVLKTEIAEGIEVESFHLVGKFNNWEPAVTPMNCNENATFRAAVELEPNRTYQLRYFDRS